MKGRSCKTGISQIKWKSEEINYDENKACVEDVVCFMGPSSLVETVEALLGACCPFVSLISLDYHSYDQS